MPPASPPPSFSHYSTEVLSQSPIVNSEHNYLILKLSEQCITIGLLLQSVLNNTEYNFLYNALRTTVKQAHIFTFIQRLHLKNSSPARNQPSQTNLLILYKTCIYFSQKLWNLLQYPYTSKVRNQIITFITVLDAFTTTYIQPLLNIKV
jgi:hypothetical protein